MAALRADGELSRSYGGAPQELAMRRGKGGSDDATEGDQSHSGIWGKTRANISEPSCKGFLLSRIACRN